MTGIRDVMTCKCFPHYWPFMRGNHQWLMGFHHKGPVMLNFDSSLLLAWIAIEQTVTIIQDAMAFMWHNCNVVITNGTKEARKYARKLVTYAELITGKILYQSYIFSSNYGGVYNMRNSITTGNEAVISWLLASTGTRLESLASHSPLTTRKNGHNFKDDIFKGIFLNENIPIFIRISLKFALKGPINTKSALVPIISKLTSF